MPFSRDNLFLHVDGDSFFVACEIAVNPKYAGKAVVVGEDRGIAVAMSNEAKKLGVTRGMPVFQIKRQFPEVIILPHHFDLYRKISQGVNDILLSHLGHVEKYSIDESFAEVRPSDVKFAGSNLGLVQAIKDEIHATLGVTYSCGLARTKALAKTASKLQKPNGVVLLLSKADEENALKKTLVKDVWGIGGQTAPQLSALGIQTAYDFATYPSDQIAKHFAAPICLLQKELLGVSMNALSYDSDPRDQKSIQSTATFRPASDDPKVIFAEISGNTERACEHARELNLMTNSVSFFVKNTQFVHQGAEVKLPVYSNNPSILLKEIERVFSQTFKRDGKIRSTGVTLGNLRRSEDVPQDLFGIQESFDSKNSIEEVGDTIRKKFGHNALQRASSLKSNNHERGNSFPKTQ